MKDPIDPTSENVFILDVKRVKAILETFDDDAPILISINGEEGFNIHMSQLEVTLDNSKLRVNYTAETLFSDMVEAENEEKLEFNVVGTTLSDPTDYVAMKDHELSEACGIDAKKWAEAFCQYAKTLYNIELDEGWVLGWFANPMMAMHDHCKGIKTTVLPDGSAFVIGEV